MARAKQSKYITLANLCDICATPTKFELVGEATGQEEGKRWAKCSKCHHTMLIDMLVIEGERRASKEVNVSVEDCIPYSPKSVYTIGDAIYHKMWDDVGTVISKELTSNGSQAIVVSFAKIGEKRLIENIA
ncbi:MAG TPA: hypothetical protein VNA88_07395 [Candidatus Kapabacteria bacterium]|jgi:hypothetical protein|nr:hypothetical protein [Candidatus Kapabacteria bacterium]